MATENNKIFRKTALERLSSPEQLDVRFKLVSYQTWLRVAIPVIILVVVAAASLWIMGPN